jgi:hypothetical protein
LLGKANVLLLEPHTQTFSFVLFLRQGVEVLLPPPGAGITGVHEHTRPKRGNYMPLSIACSAPCTHTHSWDTADTQHALATENLEDKNSYRLLLFNEP